MILPSAYGILKHQLTISRLELISSVCIQVIVGSSIPFAYFPIRHLSTQIFVKENFLLIVGFRIWYHQTWGVGVCKKKWYWGQAINFYSKFSLSADSVLFQASLPIDRFRLRNDLPKLLSHIYLLRDERKKRDNAHVRWREKGEREHS